MTFATRPGDLQGDANDRQESNFGHRTSCLHNKQHTRRAGYRKSSSSSLRGQRNQLASSVKSYTRLSVHGKTQVPVKCPK